MGRRPVVWLHALEGVVRIELDTAERFFRHSKFRFRREHEKVNKDTKYIRSRTGTTISSNPTNRSRSKSTPVMAQPARGCVNPISSRAEIERHPDSVLINGSE